MKSIARIFISTALTVAMLGGSAGISTAQTLGESSTTSIASVAQSNGGGCTSGLTPGSLVASVSDEKTLDSYRNRVSKELRAGTLNSHAKLLDSDVANAKVTKVTRSGIDSYAVTIPVRGIGVSQPLSHFTAVYQQEKLQNYSEVAFSRNAKGNFQLTGHTNGKLTTNQDTGKRWVSDAEIAQEPRSSLTSRGLGEKAACVGAVLGVGAIVAWAIVTTCGASCGTAVTNPASATVCAACVGAIATFGGGALVAVIECFKL